MEMKDHLEAGRLPQPEFPLRFDPMVHSSPPDPEPAPDADASSPGVPAEQPEATPIEEELQSSSDSVPAGDGADLPPPHKNGHAEVQSTPAPKPASKEAIHDWLSERMIQLQREQQSRWQRLLRLLTGR